MATEQIVNVAEMDFSALCRAVADASPMPMAGLGGSLHTLRYVNLAFCLLTGKSKDELLGTAFSSIAHCPDECMLLLDRVAKTGLADSHTGQEHNGIHPLYWSYAMWPLRGANQNHHGIMVQVTEAAQFHQDAVAMNEALLLGSVRQHELTEAADLLNVQLQAAIIVAKNAEAALIGSEKLAFAGRMAAVLAHEINNPLDAAMNLLFLAQTTGETPSAIRQYLETADGELKRVAHITRQTLGFYRESSEATTFLVVTLLNSVIDLLQAKRVSTQVIVEKQCDDLLQITAVFGELRQVISNLMLNSLDALGEGGRVTLRASTSRDPLNGSARIRITLADSGQGIDAAVLPRIFEPFFTTKGSIGNGLGLWVCKQIIEKHSGTIKVRSRTDDRHGTTFSLVLPE
ncbi:PAS domain-containing sensor histidine kinase [Granulicella tundricola]|uniref:histidine kinase n=1 Tax=Granulicella tundricola (strain ATCC BAA-1859 / DSM 23138 / MP5ACTX9) TaxID=1198114 RepID=E8WVP7_GRATM|nr:PAS domain-containing sensor histidine kinase [Granulicella tundricola]ADW69576.1 histidine kinase [Granulicella tundricola MP5ACTX9]